MCFCPLNHLTTAESVLSAPPVYPVSRKESVHTGPTTPPSYSKGGDAPASHTTKSL